MIKFCHLVSFFVQKCSDSRSRGCSSDILGNKDFGKILLQKNVPYFAAVVNKKNQGFATKICAAKKRTFKA